MKLDFGFVMAAAITTASTSCSWAHPGANPYRGDPTAAIADYRMPDDTRRKLKAMMQAHAYTDVVTITRDDISGASSYGELRDMHSGHGQLCHGRVNRTAWAPAREERGLVYCADDTCVIVPTICNNVSLVTRRRPVAKNDEPLDIEPAAGPPSAPAAAPTTEPETFAGGRSTPEGVTGGGVPVVGGGGPGLVTDTPPGGGGSPGLPVQPSGPGFPSGPILPIGPGRPTSPVPEPATWAMLVAGLALSWRVGRKALVQAPQAAKSGFSKPGLP